MHLLRAWDTNQTLYIINKQEVAKKGSQSQEQTAQMHLNRSSKPGEMSFTSPADQQHGAFTAKLFQFTSPL